MQTSVSDYFSRWQPQQGEIFCEQKSESYFVQKVSRDTIHTSSGTKKPIKPAVSRKCVVCLPAFSRFHPMQGVTSITQQKWLRERQMSNTSIGSVCLFVKHRLVVFVLSPPNTRCSSEWQDSRDHSASTTLLSVVIARSHRYISHPGDVYRVQALTSVVLKPWPARPSGVAREAIFIGKKT